ncbi:MAG: tRNA lysidine(34) synthetase TilS [Lewinellaceae bacterium]|nr:tRNA lysidine(34) synthetase TilS [Lewinellaceae bacterium]
MLPAIRAFFNSLDPKYASGSYLIAVSGGRDSMALLHAMHQLKLNLGVAHVHFGLRPEADLDRELVLNYSKQLSIPCYTIAFDTKQFALDHKQSTQEAARKLRYDWFVSLKERHTFDYIVTAHHQDDLIETWMIHAIRGSGWRGMMSIPENNTGIIRPLLKVPRAMIDEYIIQNEIPYLEDASNNGDDYLRNRIRHHLLPLVDELSPERNVQLAATIDHLKDAGELLSTFLDELSDRVIVLKDGVFQLRPASLRQYPRPAYVLGELLRCYGFSFAEAESLWNAFSQHHTGAEVSGELYDALVDRETILIRPKMEEMPKPRIIKLTDLPIEVSIPSGTLKLTQSFMPEHFNGDNRTFYFNKDMISWPLTWGPWKPGDRIRSFGMAGRNHRVQDLLTDARLTKWEKERFFILRDQEAIVWIPGLRMAEKGRCKPGQSCITMQFEPTVS